MIAAITVAVAYFDNTTIPVVPAL